MPSDPPSAPSAPTAEPDSVDRAVRGCTGLKLRALTRVVTRHYDARLTSAGLRLTQYSLLSYLRSSGEIGHSALAQQLGMDRTTLTRNLRPLVDAGWVVQRRSAADGRSSSLSLSDAGLQRWAQARPLWRAAQDSLNETLGHARVAELHQLLESSTAILAPGAPDAH